MMFLRSVYRIMSDITRIFLFEINYWCDVKMITEVFSVLSTIITDFKSTH